MFGLFQKSFDCLCSEPRRSCFFFQRANAKLLLLPASEREARCHKFQNEVKKGATMRESFRWYDRTNWSYTADRKIAEAYATWLKQIDWQLFCTFTFAWPVSDPQANEVFSGAIHKIEEHYRSDVGYVRGDEKRFSGCGKPACPRHYHALLTCAAPLSPTYVADLWMSIAGHRSDGAGAEVDVYDADKNGASYVLKLINQPGGDWTPRKLELFLPAATIEVAGKRMRRHLRRHHAREQQFARHRK
jgi:hypothetical protein